MADENKKFSDEELKSIKEIQNKYIQIQMNLGKISIAKVRIESQFKNLLSQEEELKNAFIDIQDQEKNFVDSVTEKYGEGVLNAETGEFVLNNSK